MKKGTPALWINKPKYKIIEIEDSEEKPYFYNGIEMIFRTKIACEQLFKDLVRRYGEEIFVIKRYH